MKLTEPFFPTRAELKSREVHQSHTLQLLKLKSSSPSSGKVVTEPVNIFRDRNNPLFPQQSAQPQFRPIGGLSLFKKIRQTCKEYRCETKKLSKRFNRDNTLRNILSSNGTRFKKEREDELQGQRSSPFKSINQHSKKPSQSEIVLDQFLKSHASYTSSSSGSKIRKTHTVKCMTASKNNRPITSKVQRQEQWATAQRKQYQDKSALLNEINYTKPLVEVYGDHYFEYMLRNRFQDSPKQTPYIYLISDNKFSDNRTINKIKHYRPDIKEREMMVLRGKKVKSKNEDF